MNAERGRQRRAAGIYARRQFLFGGAATGVAIALAACGGTNNKNAVRTATSAAPAGGGSAPAGSPRAGGTAAPAAGNPQYGGILSQPIASDPQALDIHQVSTYVAVWPEAPCYNQLLQIDPADASDAKIVADLADSWETPDKGLTYIFHLHPGIKFHDGTPLTAEDIKANLDWIKSPTNKKPSPRAGVLAAVESVQATDPQTLTIKLKQPNPSLLANLATHYFAIGPKAVIDSAGDLGDKFIGTGPFQLKTYNRGDRIELVKNPNYWVQGRPYLDGLNFYIVPDANTAFTNFLGGQYQKFHQILHENLGRVKSESGGKATYVTTPTYTRNIIFFNTTKKPWDDLRVRQAVSLLLDRDDAIQAIDGGDGERGGYMRVGGQWGLPVEQLKTIPGYDKGDINQAKALLQQAGVQLPIRGSLLSRNDFNNEYTYVQQALAKGGIQLDLDARDNAAAYDAAYKGQFDLIAWVVSIVLDDPDATFAEISTSNAVRNWSALKDPQIDDLYAKQTVELDYQKRKQLVNQMDMRALSIFQTVCIDFIKYNEGLATSVKNYTFHGSLYTNNRMQDVWMTK
jgi:peptide/nickel transport system substrate-binding protein